MKIFGLAGWSGSGKTTLMEGLVRDFTRRGLVVSTMKHAHCRVDIDKKGKDTFRHREAGASEVMLVSPDRWALMHEMRGEAEPSMEDLAARMSPADLLLVEGFRSYPHPKIEVYRPAFDKGALWPDDPTIVAIATDADLQQCELPVLDLNDAKSIADFIASHLGL